MIDRRPSEQRDYGDYRLVICLERFWPARGGVERYALALARWFSRRVPVIVITAVRERDSLRAELFAWGRSSVERSVSPAAVDVFTAGLGRSGRTAFRTISITEELIHKLAPSHYYRTRWVARRLTAALLARDLIRSNLPHWEGDRVVVHAMGPGELSDVGARLFPGAALVATPFIHPGFWWEDRYSVNWFRRCDRIIALGVEDSHTCEGMGIPSELISVVPTFWAKKPRLGTTREWRGTVVFLGVARPYKGVDLFVDAFELLRARLPQIKFVWAGRIPDAARVLAASAKAKGLDVRGEISDEQKSQLLQSAVCVCLPSATEIAPYAILEAWSHGAPVVATDNAYFREFVRDGGVFIERNSQSLATAIERLVQDPDLAERCALAGQILLRHHDPDLVGPELERAYRLALDHKADAAGKGFDGMSRVVRS